MINEEGRLSNTVVNEALEKYDRLDPRDKALFVKLVYGTLDYQIQTDYILNLYSKTKVGKMKSLVRNVLRMGVYQLLHMDKIPDSAVCDESVKLVKKTALRNLGGFVNGVLRNIARDKDEIISRLNDGETAEMSGDGTIVPLNKSGLEKTQVRFSVQEWMLKLLSESIGEEATEKFLAYSLETHGVTFRTVGSDEVFVAEDAGKLIKSDDWKNGKLIVQDLSSSMPVKLSSMKEGDAVIDVCAAPGGKSIQAAERVKVKNRGRGEEANGVNGASDTEHSAGRVIACDLTEFKLEKIRENIKRLKIDNIDTVLQDATVRNEKFVGMADVVLADLPCSGIGTISKKPEIKNRLSLDDCKALAEIQKKILNNVCDYVKSGGELIFSTCTLDHFENEDNTRAFLKTHPEFELTEERTLLPSDFPQDGFYIAVMKKCHILSRR